MQKHLQMKTIIWRYMPLDKYIDLLYRKELFLCRLDKLEDPQEGSWTKQEIDKSPWPEDAIQEFKEWSFINCWHLNKVESAAMWELYSSKNAGIAIKTTIGKLKNSLKEDSKRLHIGKVNYVDNYIDDLEYSLPQDSNRLTMLGPVFKKRKSFLHENRSASCLLDYRTSSALLRKSGLRKID